MARFAALAIVIGTLTGALYFPGLGPLFERLEHRFLFSPGPVEAESLARIPSREHGVEEVRLATPDGVTLHGWLKRPVRLRPGARYPLVIVYGGVRRDLSQVVRRAKAPGEWGWLLMNYRGFGLSEGVPAERYVIEDATRIYDWAAARPDVDASNIVVLGRSLGSYVAVAVAAARQARAAILATPFDSFLALAEKRYPHLPLGWVVDGRFDSVALAPRVSAPALFVLAEFDDVTPVEHGRALAAAWGGRTQTVLLRGASHYGIEGRDEFWRSVGDYLAKLRATRAPRAGSAAAAACGAQNRRVPNATVIAPGGTTRNPGCV
jgi:pimeloyl-ACP methyl ester carboxylesterase